MKRIATVAAFSLLVLLVVAMSSWGVFAIAYSAPQAGIVNNTLACAFAIASLTVLIALGSRRWRWRSFTAYLVLFAALVVWWRGIEPSNERDWQADVAVLPYADIDGDEIVVQCAGAGGGCKSGVFPTHPRRAAH
jgi:hypothetical protein